MYAESKWLVTDKVIVKCKKSEEKLRKIQWKE